MNPCDLQATALHDGLREFLCGCVVGASLMGLGLYLSHRIVLLAFGPGTERVSPQKLDELRGRE